MAVKIRLTRMGRTNTPFFRVVATDIRAPSKGRFLERLGWYDPKGKDRFELNLERIDYWVNQGAQVSPTVKTLARKMRRRESIPAEPAAAPEPEAVPSAPVKIAGPEAAPPAGEE